MCVCVRGGGGEGYGVLRQQILLLLSNNMLGLLRELS